jgi:hypothetical protein
MALPRVVGLASLCLLVGVACGAIYQQGPTVIRVQRIVIVDESNREVGRLTGTKGQATLELLDLKNNTVAGLSAEQEASLTLGTKGQGRLRLVNKSNLSALEMRDGQGVLQILVGISDQRKPKVALMGSDSKILWIAPPEQTEDGEGRLPAKQKRKSPAK